MKKNNTTMKKNLVKKNVKSQRKSNKRRIYRERSNNAMLNRTEKTKQ